VREIRFDSGRLLSDSQREFFQLARIRGFRYVFEVFQNTQCPNNYEIAHFWASSTLGELILQRIPDQLKEAYLPYHCIDVECGIPRPKAVRVRIRSLHQEKSVWGTVYYSRRCPKLTIDGQQLTVAFSDHAIRRIAERTVYDWKTYNGLGDVFGYVENCVYFEDCTQVLGQPAFAIYNRCAEGFFSYTYAEQVLKSIEPGVKYFYRIGYCPAVIDSDFVKAKTLLVPGMRGTPENDLVDSSSLPRAEKQQMSKRAGALSYKSLVDTSDFSLLRWFHENGVPQVVSLPDPVFVYN
jgi:hypothetical protein